MEIGLNRKQLQETLREMGVDFPSDASRDDLIKILDQANQKQWLRAAHRDSAGRNGRIIRRKGGNLQQSAEKIAAPQAGAIGPEKPSPSVRGPKVEPTPKAWETSPPTTKSDEHTKTPIFDRTQDLKAYALERAKGICDLCNERPVDKTDSRPIELKPCFFIDPPEDKPHSIKTVAALCPGCFERVSAAPSLPDIRLLKRKARQTRVNEITITNKKKPPAARKPKPARYGK